MFWVARILLWKWLALVYYYYGIYDLIGSYDFYFLDSLNKLF